MNEEALTAEYRLPRDTGDPACAMPQYSAYLRLLREMNEQDAKEKESVFSSEKAMWAIGFH